MRPVGSTGHPQQLDDLVLEAIDYMAKDLPPELTAILEAPDLETRERAWGHFVAIHSRLLLFVARSLGQDYDAAMDRYAFALEHLHDDDFRRLRGYTSEGRTKFTTWLLVVTRRLCLDHYRQRYGRAGGSSGEDDQRSRGKAARRQLADSIGERIDPALLADQSLGQPGADLDASQRRAQLESVVASLAAQDRLLLKLRFEDDLSAREIAGVAGFATPFHVYRRLNALLSTLRASLSHRGFDRSDL